MNISKILSSAVLLITLFLFYSCSPKKEDKFIGYWIEDGKEHSEVLEIKKEGDKLYLNSKDLDVPATYNKDDNTLSAQITNGLASANILMNIVEDPDKMKMSIGSKAANFSKVSKEKAAEYKQANDTYYDPNFFVGEWKSEVEQEKPLKIIKEEGAYFYVSDFLGKQRLVYDDKKHMMTGQMGPTTLIIKRSGDQEITAYGKKYKKIK